MALEDSEEALERVLAGYWQALGRVLEASKRYLAPKIVIGRICGRFLKKIEIYGGPS